MKAKITLTEEQSVIILKLAAEVFPEYYIRFGTGKWNEREFLWIYIRDKQGVPNLIMETHWYEFCSQNLSHNKRIKQILTRSQ